MVKAKTLEAEKVLLEADGFRLGVDPTPDDVHTANWLIDRLSSMAQPVTPQEAARVLLEAIDAFMDGEKLTEEQSELQKSAFHAGCFAAAAYDAHTPKSGGEYYTLTRSFLLALIDPTHEDLDYLRSDPSSGRVAREADAALRAITEPPQENALQELADLGQEFDAAPTRWIRLEPPQSGESS